MRLLFAEEFHQDLDRIRGHLLLNGAHVEARIAEIFLALKILERNPYIGYEAEEGMRELVIGDRGRNRGYFALYDIYEEPDDDSDDDPDGEAKGLVVVNAIRSQHESGYR